MITVSANAADLDGTVAKVDFYAGTTLIGTATAAPYGVNWTNVAAGNYSLTVVAMDNDGANTTSAPIAIRVNSPPTVSVTAPSANTVVGAPATLTVSANAADSDGAIAKVDFYAGTTLIGTAIAAPFSVNWANVAAGTYTVTAIATDNDGAATTSTAVAIRVNAPPTVSLTAPAANTVANAPATVTVNANAADSDGTVAKVDFYAGTTLIGTATAAPYSVSWANIAAGSYSLTAIATDNDGASTAAAGVSIRVNAAPTVSLTAPAASTVVNAPATVTVSANATDSDGTLAKVEFYAGTTLIGTAVTAPYSISWANVSAGSYSLTAIAVDSDGATTSSTAVSIVVNALPTVSLSAPAGGASFNTPANVTVTAAAADSDGTVAKVEFYAGPTLIGTATAAPYTIQWANVAAGDYSLTAVATDNLGGTATSAAVAVTVKSPANIAAFVSQVVPATMAPGVAYTVSVTMKNTGATTWTAAGLYQLSAQNPQDNTTWGRARVQLPYSVAPGASVIFSFQVTAPSAAGSYSFQWRMVQDGVESFGDSSTSVAVVVATPTRTPSYLGTFDFLSCNFVAGWVWDGSQPNTPINVDIYVDTTLVMSALAADYRADLQSQGYGNGNHGFTVRTPAFAIDSRPHPITLKYGGTQQAVAYNNPKTLNCVAPGVNAVNGAKFISQSAPPSIVAPGQSYPVTVTLQNTGNTTWTTSNSYALASQNPQNNSSWGMSRVALPNDVAPGANVTFSFNATAPAAMGTYNFQWQMVQDGGVGAFGDTTTNVSVKDGIDNAKFVSQSVPGIMAQGQTYAVSVTMQNTGNTTWKASSGYRLVSQNPAGNSTWGVSQALLPNDVAPGESVTFSFNVTSPAARGTYNFQWRMTHDGVAAFGDTSPNVAVGDGLDGATFVSQSVPTSMTPGQSYAVSVTMQNSGNTTWTSAEQIALASQNPQDNTNWGAARLQLPNDVAPGASVTFSFNAVAPAAVGAYSFRWRMVRGAVGFGDASADAKVHVGTAPANVYFIQPDHLGTPRLIADENQKIVWRWDNQEPFGADMPNEDPDGDGVAFDFPMRFPGQYFDRETNLAYNMARDYSADLGRYVESDPIGLGGGLNTYSYVGGDPLRATDPSGEIIPVVVAIIKAIRQLDDWLKEEARKTFKDPNKKTTKLVCQ
jgi:RHS repeat-associated protein